MGCGSSKPGPKLTKVVIIGGGYGGSILARLMKLENFCELTLIEPKEAMIQTHAIPRCIVEPDFLNKVVIPYGKFIGDNHLRSTVASINHRKKLVILDSGKKMRFDYLVICSGQTLSFPRSLRAVAPNATTKEIFDIYRRFNFDMKRSPEMVIIGGSQFAVELAGELRTDYPDKKVTIISEQKKLLSNQTPQELHAALDKILYRKEVDVYLETSVPNLDSLVCNQYKKEQIVKTSGGKDIVADLIINSDQCSYATEFCSNPLPGLPRDGDGALKVDEYLRVENCADIFAFGDVISSKHDKGPEMTKKQANVIAANIKSLATSQEIPALQSFRPEPQPILVAFGSYDGAGFSNGNLLDEEDKLLTDKSLNFFVENMWKDLGIFEPE